MGSKLGRFLKNKPEGTGRGREGGRKGREGKREKRNKEAVKKPLGEWTKGQVSWE